MVPRYFAVLAALMLLSWFQPAVAQDTQDLPAGGMTAPEVAAWLRQSGYPATLKPDPLKPGGQQIISSTVDGVNFDIYMYQCKNNRCSSLQYAAGFRAPSVTLDKINAWNHDKRYIRAYLGKSVWGEYDIDIYPGGTYEGLNYSLRRWRAVVIDFQKYLTR